MKKNLIGIEAAVIHCIDKYFSAMYHDVHGYPGTTAESEYADLCQAFNEVFEYVCDEPQNITANICSKIEDIKAVVDTDIEAAYRGDPAAKSKEEVIVTYPAFRAISMYRLAHELYKMQVPLVPRMMSEVMHRRTAIDIHPGAEIGPYFFIDHGTGVVIGETAVIGKHVKLYQNVTLGALSFPENDDGSLVKGIKRHPNVEDGVVIYSGATILGGETTIGKDSVIGGGC